ncbi:MAG: phosphoribosylaminoimidazolesuccinocarboxamide synthase [Nitrospirae bacterium RBG_19FT_COMBO_42_15]|nr:MAG: phosphoribosylaminoimidazolesuccinocarboxamide synthase [Nitrospirae bacterium RBG_19FT_COMBO_42_15]
MEKVILQTNLNDIKLLRRGKVRDIYDLGEYLLLIASDRVSAFDVVLPNGIPGKGKILTQISIFWFNEMNDIISNHLVATDVKDFPAVCRKYADQLEGRSMLVKKSMPLPVECIVRGYLSGSGWKEYKDKGIVCGIKLNDGLLESAKLDEPIFTPSTKADEGHDINISFEEAKKILGQEMAEKARELSLRIYIKAGSLAEKRGIIIADTKFEFGTYNNELILIDEILTPDSSRFWSKKDYQVGKGQDSFDKQIVREYLLTLSWNQQPPGPKLPEDIIEKAGARYKEILGILTGINPKF